MGCVSLPKDLPLGIDLGFSTSMPVQEEPMWHLVRRFQDHGHLLNVGLHVSSLIADHGVSPQELGLKDLAFEATALPAPTSTSSPAPAAAPSSMIVHQRGEAKLDVALDSDIAKQLPMDYWDNYDSQWQ